MNRRECLKTIAAGLATVTLPQLVLADGGNHRPMIGAAWRGPKPSDPYFAGVLVADWESKTLSIRYAVPLPTRPHGLLAEPGDGLLVAGVRPGGWLLRCDGEGRVKQRLDLEREGSCRLAGHMVAAGELLLTTETDFATGQGRIGVRDFGSLRKQDEWDTHGIDPHQLLLDDRGDIVVANGGVPRTIEDKKVELHRMDSSLARIEGKSGRLLGQWRLEDRRLSMRHLAWTQPSQDARPLLGIALQAEHAEADQRAAAPVLAVFDGERLAVPTAANDGVGYCGDIASAHRGGLVVSSHQSGQTLLWHPEMPGELQPVVKLKETYALASWHGPGRGGGILVATAFGLGRWHPEAPPMLLPWPQPMALDNHWVLMKEA